MPCCGSFGARLWVLWYETSGTCLPALIHRVLQCNIKHKNHRHGFSNSPPAYHSLPYYHRNGSEPAGAGISCVWLLRMMQCGGQLNNISIISITAHLRLIWVICIGGVKL